MSQKRHFFLNFFRRKYLKNHNIGPRSQSTDFRIYNYSASVVVGYIERFYSWKSNFYSKARYAIGGVVNFCNAGAVTRGRT
jgi:hypothetical protein